jgi:predicted TIM-barrel fold metal-dependent hydrolase
MRPLADHDAPVTSILTPLETDEYTAPPRAEVQARAAGTAAEAGAEAARRVGVARRDYAASRRGTAAGLLSVNDALRERFFEVPDEAALDDAAAVETFSSGVPVIDVQTHWIAQRPTLMDFQDTVLHTYQAVKPDWWTGLDDVAAYNMAEYLRCVFVEAETALGIISCAPGNAEGEMFLRNDEMAGMRELFDRTAGTGRLLNHTVVRPTVGDVDDMEEWVTTYRPSGWKVYTMGVMDADYHSIDRTTGWQLDDDTGMAFLEEARRVGVPLVCAHKGVSGMVDAGSPRDVGPAATSFPDIDFLIYHSGYEPGMAEGPYTDETSHLGVNRLIKSLEDSGLGHGSNVYAELGTTWFCTLSRPEDAAHTLGKLLVALGEDNIIWGTDSIWYGPTQPALDAFWAFQIPDRMCEEFGYPKITDDMKRKIISANAAGVYGVDLVSLEAAAASDDLSWTRDVISHYGDAV